MPRTTNKNFSVYTGINSPFHYNGGVGILRGKYWFIYSNSLYTHEHQHDYALLDGPDIDKAYLKGCIDSAQSGEFDVE